MSIFWKLYVIVLRNQDDVVHKKNDAMKVKIETQFSIWTSDYQFFSIIAANKRFDAVNTSAASALMNIDNANI